MTSKDLENALQTKRHAVELTTDTHADRSGWLQGLGASFLDRYRRLGDRKDLLASLKAHQEAVDQTPQGHPDRAGRLQAFGASLMDNY
jgi:hypothetical protein